MKKLLSFTLTLLLILALAACGGGGSDGSSGSSGAGSGEVQAEDGFAEARIGDVVHSYFMDFTVNGAYTTAEYHGHTMYDDDFQGQWSASAETEEYAWPITEGEDGSDLDTVAEEQLPAQYELGVNESRTGMLVFDVPADEKDFSISHLELFDDGSEGDTFFVYFTAEAK